MRGFKNEICGLLVVHVGAQAKEQRPTAAAADTDADCFCSDETLNRAVVRYTSELGSHGTAQHFTRGSSMLRTDQEACEEWHCAPAGQPQKCREVSTEWHPIYQPFFFSFNFHQGLSASLPISTCKVLKAHAHLTVLS